MKFNKTKIHVAASRIHKWLALLVGLQVMVWMISGLVMSAVPIGVVRGEHLIDRDGQDRIVRTQRVRPLEEIVGAAQGPVETVMFRMHDGRLMAEVAGSNWTGLVDPYTAQRLPRVERDAAATIALRRWKGPTNPSVAVEAVDQLSPEFRGPLPAWRVIIDGSTRVYVSAETGQIRAVRTDTWRIYDFLWGLHIMDWKEHDNFNNIWLVSFASSGLLFALTGFVLLTMRFPMRLTRRRKAI
ncbi:MAG: hypothetical protein O9283_04015 [Sphingomonadaceae bacterium]|jgi:hypothetical protein|nr:hypothetical protein [Sphingomonadaceae bacterium]